MRILTFHGNQPCIEVQDGISGGENTKFGLNRDRCPDTDWSEFRRTRLDTAKEVDLTEELKKILIEDICEYYKGDKAYSKLLEFDLIK